MDNKMTHQNTLLTQTKMCPKGFDDEQAHHPTIQQPNKGKVGARLGRGCQMTDI